MALTLSSIVVVLICTVFLVQNRYYAVQNGRSGAQDVVRAVTERVAEEVRPAVRGAVTLAQPDSLTVRSPMVMAAVCGVTGSDAWVQMEGGESGLAPDEVAGLAVLDPGTGRWIHHPQGWSSLDGGTAGAAAACAANGADTVGAVDEFHRLAGVAALHGSVPPPGSLVMLYRETTFSFRPSEMEPGVRGFFRAVSGADPAEYATGLDSTAAFLYGTLPGGAPFQSSVSGAALDAVSVVRVVAEARKRVPAGGVDDVTFGWAVNIPLGNVQ